MISHRNVIANTMQIRIKEQPERDVRVKRGGSATAVNLGLLPQSHIYALVVLCHAGSYRGDSLVVLPKFDMAQYLTAIAKYKINTLFLVPPIIIAMLRNKAVCDKVDLSSVASIFTGAAPLGKETAEELQAWKPSWAIKQGYGRPRMMTPLTYSQTDTLTSHCMQVSLKLALWSHLQASTTPGWAHPAVYSLALKQKLSPRKVSS